MLSWRVIRNSSSIPIHGRSSMLAPSTPTARSAPICTARRSTITCATRFTAQIATAQNQPSSGRPASANTGSATTARMASRLWRASSLDCPRLGAHMSRYWR